MPGYVFFKCGYRTVRYYHGHYHRFRPASLTQVTAAYVARSIPTAAQRPVCNAQAVLNGTSA